MRLRAYCQHCEFPNKINSRGVITKRDLEGIHGEYVDFQCDSCLGRNKVHVNLVSAIESKLPTYLCYVIGGLILVFTAMFFNIITLSLGATFISAGAIAGNSTNSTAFNTSKI